MVTNVNTTIAIEILNVVLTAMVRVVQSQMAKGTSRHLAMVCASRVFPLPVEPNIMMFDFSS